MAEPGTYAARIIHTEKVDNREEIKGPDGKKIENARLKIVLALLDPALSEVRVRTNINLWHHKPEVADTADGIFQMVLRYAGASCGGQGSNLDTNILKGRKIGITVEKACRFDDAGNRIEFNEVKRWHPGPEFNRQTQAPTPTPTTQAAGLADNRAQESGDLWFA